MTEQDLKFPLMRPTPRENEMEMLGKSKFDTIDPQNYYTKNSITPGDLVELNRSKDASYNLFDYMRAKSMIVPAFPSVKEWGKVETLKKNLVKDVLAGITVTTVVCTEGLAIALMAGLQPHYALYTAAVPTITYALFGSSRNLAVGPAAVVGILMGSALQDIPEPERPQAAACISLMQGLFLLGLGFLRLGFIEYILSLPALKGFIAGIIIRIMIEQFQNVIGVKLHAHESIEKIEELIHRSNEWNYAGLVVGLFVMAFLAILLIIKTITKSKHMVFAIGPLLSNVIGSIIVNFLGLPEKYGIKLVKDIETDIPRGLEFSNPFKNFSEYSGQFLTPVIVMGIVGFIETIAISKEIAAKNGYKIDATNEFKSFGVANIVASFMNSMPAFGSLARTPISASSGSQSQLCCFLTGLGVVFVLYAGIFLIKMIPLCVVGATILFAVSKQVRLLKLAFLIKYFPFPDAFIMALAMIVTIVIDPEIGAGTTIFFSLLIILKRGTTPFVHVQHYDKIIPIRHVHTYKNNAGSPLASSGSLEYSTLEFTVERDTNPNHKYENYRTFRRHESQSLYDWEKGKYKDFCMCLDLDCPQKYHVLVITLPHYYFYVNAHSLKIYLETLHDFTPLHREMAETGVHGDLEHHQLPAGGAEVEVPKPNKTINAVLIDCHLTRYFDYTGSHILAEVCEEFEKMGVSVGLAELDMQHLAKIKATGLRNRFAKYSNRDSVEIIEKLMDKVLSKRLATTVTEVTESSEKTVALPLQTDNLLEDLL